MAAETTVKETVLPCPGINERHCIKGTRVSVWNILHYYEHDWTIQEIADVNQLTTAEVEAALSFIEANHDFVTRVHREIEEHRVRWYASPKIQAMRRRSRAKLLERIDEIERERREQAHDPGRVG